MSDEKNAAPKLQVAQAKAVQTLDKDFCARLPQEMRRGDQYAVKPGDRFVRQRIAVPDGRYRMLGSEFVFTIAGARLIQAVRALPPDFGGPGVVEVEFDAGGVIKP